MFSLRQAASKSEWQQKIQEIKHQSNLLEASIKSTDDIQFQIRNFYPYPLAFGYRILGNMVNPLELYPELLRIGENILGFLGSVCLALLDKADLEKIKVDPKGIWLSGLTPGKWKNIISLSADLLVSHKSELTASIVSLKIDSPKSTFGSAVEKFVQARNNYHHNRLSHDEETIRTAIPTMTETINVYMKELGFFTEYPIRLVRDFDFDENRGYVLQCLRLIGDHPGLPQESLCLPKPVSKDQLYIDLGKQEWVKLSPFIVAHNCEQCQTREIFFTNKWDLKPSGRVSLMSFERGHIYEDKLLSMKLADWMKNLRPLDLKIPFN